MYNRDVSSAAQQSTVCLWMVAGSSIVMSVCLAVAACAVLLVVLYE